MDRGRRQAPTAGTNTQQRKSGNGRRPTDAQNKQSAFAEELAKAL
jgi:hypothetical protein